MTVAPLSFPRTLRQHRLVVEREALQVLQVNLGWRCNQACRHCHVDAGPGRTEQMDGATVDRVLKLLAQAPQVKTVDITGGAPELHPLFRHLVRGARALGRHVIDRCNLTVLLQPGQEDTPFFLRDQGVEIIASLPCYSESNVDFQRGRGTFRQSIEALRLLNRLGYGQEGSELFLHLVYNPTGPFLPPPQAELEAEYKRHLREDFGIVFHRLLTLTNMPIRRFLKDLERRGQRESYLDLLVRNFNPEAAVRVMCRNLISVGWDGKLYDCDFNQMLGLPLGGHGRTVWEISSFSELQGEPIAFGTHCYGCTAGAGSSCGGALT